VARAELTFIAPMSFVPCSGWRCRFDASTRSPSARPSRPIPAPAGADDQNTRILELQLAGEAELRQPHLARVARQLVGVESRWLHAASGPEKQRGRDRAGGPRSRRACIKN
jgi:hypothetical protein